MKGEILDVQVDYARAGLEGAGQPKLYAYTQAAEQPDIPAGKRPAIVICPGGGYAMTSDREAEPIARRFLSLGFPCFVLRYTVGASLLFPAPQLELAAAVAMVRSRAEEWRIDPDKIVVCGFSAGGHLAASLGMFWNRSFLTDPLGFQHGEARPNGLILAYPVITSGPFTHLGSMQNLLGSRYEECLELVSLEKQVTADTPPVFLWHTFEDSIVPVENALLLAAALREKGISLEMHILPHGDHGLALADEEGGMVMPACQPWPQWASRWLRDL